MLLVVEHSRGNKNQVVAFKLRPVHVSLSITGTIYSETFCSKFRIKTLPVTIYEYLFTQDTFC